MKTLFSFLFIVYSVLPITVHANSKKTKKMQFDLVGFVTGDFVTSSVVELATDQNQRVRVPRKLLQKYGYTGDEKRGTVVKMKLTSQDIKQISTVK